MTARTTKAFVLLTLVVALRAAAPAATAAPPRLVAIGDVHGAADAFTGILTRAGLVDAQRQWTGGQTVLVQTGDVTDRGAGARDALDLLMALEKQAASAGGKVHVLLGNHELMNMLGETRDASAELIGAFGGEAAYRAAFAKDGRYGKWLRTKPIIAEIDGTAFMHAGINLEFTTESIDALNKRARLEIRQWDDGVKFLLEKKLIQPSSGFMEIATAARLEIEQLNAAIKAEKLPPDARTIATLLPPVANIHVSSLFHPEGPMWFRGFATWTDADGATRMAAVLKHHRLNRFVTGHTAQPDGRIKERFGKSLFLIDTGMLGGKWFPSGRASALELGSTSATPIYVE